MSAFGNLDTGFPMFNSKMNTEQKLKAMEDYLVQVLEQLRYTLNNLGADNFNETDLKTLSTEITQPVYAKIEDVDSDLRTEITATAEGVAVDIRKDYATSWVTGTVYKVNDVIKRETTQSGVVTAVGFYKCKKEHTAADNNRPPTGAYWSDYWSVLQSADALQSRFVMNAEGVKSTVAKSIQQYKAPPGVTFSVYGYGAPAAGSAASHNNQYYLDQDSGKYYKSNGSAWTLQGTCGLTVDDKQDSATLITTINQSADKIESSAVKTDNNGGTLASYITQQPTEIALAVQGVMANEWASGQTYYTEDVVKVTTTSGGTTTVKFYRCKYAGSHTSAAGNKPGSGGSWTTYWDEIPNANVQSVISANLNGITLSYDNSQVGSGDNNASYIKLTKDGTEIAGGKVKVTNLDASTITTGTLDANVITLREAFSVQSRDRLGNWQDCGHIGGHARLNGNNEIELTSSNGKCRLGVEDGAVYMEAVDPSDPTKLTSVDVLPDYVEIMARSGTDRVWLEVTSTAINFKKAGGTWHDLFDLI